MTFVRRRGPPLGALAVLVVVAVASMGVLYTLWAKTLTIEGTVLTGSVNAEFTGAFTDDDGAVNDPTDANRDANDDGLDPAATGADPKPRYDKNVAHCVNGMVDEDPEQDGMQGGWVYINNGYPSYHCTAWFGVHNNGTIPVKVQSISQSMDVDHWYSCDSGQTWAFAGATAWYPYCGTSVVKYVDLDEDHSLWDLDVHITGLDIGDQIHPGERPGIDVDLHVAQGAEQNATYQVSHKVFLVQWNEYLP